MTFLKRVAYWYYTAIRASRSNPCGIAMALSAERHITCKPEIAEGNAWIACEA